MVDSAPKVLLCGPFPGEGMVGGYARANELLATSDLARRIGIERLPVTLPHEGGLTSRLARDIRRARLAVCRPGIRILHLTAQYQTGTYREWLQYRIAKRAGLRFLLDIRAGCFVEAYEDSRRPLQRRLWSEILRGADAITVEGRRDAAWLARRFGVEATWFPNFVRSDEQERRAAATLAPPAPGGPLVLVYAGQLRPEKGLAELVAACARLEARGTTVRLDLAGVGSPGFRSELELAARELARSRVRFLGRLEHGALLDALRAAHVFVFPSRWPCEGHSNAVNEAMQMGLPVVATRQGFSEDVVTPECGRLVDAPEPEALAHAIAELASDWEALRSCGLRARERVYSEFGDRVVLARLESVYRSLLADA